MKQVYVINTKRFYEGPRGSFEHSTLGVALSLRTSYKMLTSVFGRAFTRQCKQRGQRKFYFKFDKAEWSIEIERHGIG